MSTFHDKALGILGLAFLLGAYLIVRHLAWIELRDSGEAVIRGLRQPIRRNQTLIIYVIFDIIILNVAMLVANECMHLLGFYADPATKRMWLKDTPMDLSFPFAFLILFRSYSRVWYLARISEYISTGLAVIVGYTVALGIRLVSAETPAETGIFITRYFMQAGLAAPLVVGLRAMPRVVQDLMQWMSHGLQRDKTGRLRVLLCGAGYQTTLFLRQLTYRDSDYSPLDIIGLVDDDDAMHGHFVHGIRVLGSAADLPQLLEQNRIDRVYIVESLNAESEKRIMEVAKAANVSLIRWSIEETEIGRT